METSRCIPKDTVSFLLFYVDPKNKDQKINLQQIQIFHVVIYPFLAKVVISHLREHYDLSLLFTEISTAY